MPLSTQGRSVYNQKTMQSGASGTGNGTALNTDGYSVAMFQISGISGDTITWEATVDGTNWAVWPAENSAGTSATTATADGIYQMELFGISQVRARVSTYSAGDIDVVGRAVA